MTPDERMSYYGGVLRDLQDIGGELVTDDLLVRAGPCLDQCPTGLHTFSYDRVEAIGFSPKRDFHYDREAVGIRTRDEKLHDAVMAIPNIGLQERTFEIVNSRIAAERKLELYCGLGETEGLSLKFIPLNNETWVMAPDGPLPTNKVGERALRDKWLAYTDACDLKKLDLYPSEIQLVRLEDYFDLKRKYRTDRIVVFMTQQIGVVVPEIRALGQSLLHHPHLLGKIIGTALLGQFPQDSTLPRVQDLLSFQLLYYILHAAEYLDTLGTAPGNDVAAYDEMGLTYEHIQDLLFVYLALQQPYPLLADFQKQAEALAAARIPGPGGLVKIRVYPTQSGMDGFAMAYVGAHAAVRSTDVGSSYFPATPMPLGDPVLGMSSGIYFETRFKDDGTGVPIFATGLATEFQLKNLDLLNKVVTAVQSSAKNNPKTVLIVDDTLVHFADVSDIAHDFHNTSTLLMDKLTPLIKSGKVDVVLVRSLQKFGSLGTRKTKAGIVTIYSTDLTPYDQNLFPSAAELMTTRGHDFQWVAFNMQFQDQNEREYIKGLYANAAMLAAPLRYTPSSFDPQVHQLAVRSFDLTDKLELRAQAFRSVPQFGTFGGPYVSHSDLGDVERFSPGLEPPDVLDIKLRFWLTNVPLRLRVRFTNSKTNDPIDLPAFRYPVVPLSNDAFLAELERAMRLAGHPLAPGYKVYQNGRLIPAGGGATVTFDFDFSMPGDPAEIYIAP